MSKYENISIKKCLISYWFVNLKLFHPEWRNFDQNDKRFLNSVEKVLFSRFETLFNLAQHWFLPGKLLGMGRNGFVVIFWGWGKNVLHRDIAPHFRAKSVTGKSELIFDHYSLIYIALTCSLLGWIFSYVLKASAPVVTGSIVLLNLLNRLVHVVQCPRRREGYHAADLSLLSGKRDARPRRSR